MTKSDWLPGSAEEVPRRQALEALKPFQGSRRQSVNPDHPGDLLVTLSEDRTQKTKDVEGWMLLEGILLGGFSL